jgi:hypothetical protein
VATKVRVCFHKRRKCSHCHVGVGGAAPARQQRRCVCCGCFVGAVARCKRCVREGFVALTLFV